MRAEDHECLLQLTSSWYELGSFFAQLAPRRGTPGDEATVRWLTYLVPEEGDVELHLPLPEAGQGGGVVGGEDGEVRVHDAHH